MVSYSAGQKAGAATSPGVDSQDASTPARALPAPGRWIALLRWAVICRLLFHALFLPMFEGPDEPYHLARAANFADSGLRRGLQGTELDGAIAAAVVAHPCSFDLAQHFGCPEFSGTGGAFNILGGSRNRPPVAPPGRNYEAHQPPLYYLLSGWFLKLLGTLPAGVSVEAPEGRLLALRLLSVFFVIVAWLWPLRLLASEGARPWEAGLLLVLLIPGAAESLARVANDAAVFLWCAVMVLAVNRAWRSWGICLLAAVGPLIKLTAVPVCVFGALWLWFRRRRWTALAATAATVAFVPIQLLRGWQWGGTLELEGLGTAWSDPLTIIGLGILHSAYTFIKTALWLGGWSVFRPPIWLLISGALLILAWLAVVRFKSAGWGTVLPHGIALLAAVAGFVAFAIGKRGVFGVWGAVGGWYAWDWLPWVAVALAQLITVKRKYRRVLVLCSVLWILAANLSWILIAIRLYGV